MTGEAWLVAALLAVWIAIGAYLWSLASRQRTLERRLSELTNQEQETNH